MDGTTVNTSFSAKFLLLLACTLCIFKSTNAAFGFGKGDRMRLEDVSVLTLRHGSMTAARRSSAVPQLKCVGGSAANAFTPQVVQCYNRGSDGYDVQWECKTDMDNAYRFGTIEVSCEGYASSDDDYVLKGSCGLEYTLEYTKEGMQKNQYNQHQSYSSYGSNHHDGSYDNDYNHNRSQRKSLTSDWLSLAVVGVVMYIIYRTCIADSVNGASGQTSDDGPPGPRGSGFGHGGGGGGGGGGGQPPPSYYPNDSCSGGAQQGGYGTGYNRNRGGGAGTGSGGGFWTGAAAGGLMGYLFGNRGGGYGGYGGYRPRRGYTRGFSSGWGGGGGGGGFSGFGGGSTGTRTASGFGGTRRR